MAGGAGQEATDNTARDSGGGGGGVGWVRINATDSTGVHATFSPARLTGLANVGTLKNLGP